MPLHPEVQAFLDAQAQIEAPPISEQTPEMAREGYRATAEAIGPGPEMNSVADRTIAGPAGEIALRIYRPTAEDGLPLLVYYHGGGWVIGDLDTHDRACRELAEGSGCVVVSVDYRLAPEAPFPAAVDDSYAALEWVAAHAEEFGGDARRLAVGGDSAGGNLAAVLCLLARDRGGPKIAFQLLVYPAVDMRFAHASVDENGEGYVLTKEHMAFFRGHYMPPEADLEDPRASPLLADSHEGLPPALVITAEFDPLRDEGEAYGAALNADGVPVEVSRYDGQVHIFFQLTPMLEGARRAMKEACDALEESLG
ncbi:MAG: alpha/beta hydrolase [Acidobacteriota bacterium]